MYFSPDSVCRKGNMELMEKEEETKFLNMEVSNDGVAEIILVAIFVNIVMQYEHSKNAQCMYMYMYLDELPIQYVHVHVHW